MATIKSLAISCIQQTLLLQLPLNHRPECVCAATTHKQSKSVAVVMLPLLLLLLLLLLLQLQRLMPMQWGNILSIFYYLCIRLFSVYRYMLLFYTHPDCPYTTSIATLQSCLCCCFCCVHKTISQHSQLALVQFTATSCLKIISNIQAAVALMQREGKRGRERETDSAALVNMYQKFIFSFQDGNKSKYN